MFKAFARMGVRQWARFGLLAAAAVAAPCWAGEGSAEGAAEDAPQYRLIGKNETLWGIALETAPSRRVSVSRYMLAIERMNPEAFLDGDINRLMAGYRLRLPSEAEALALTAETGPPSTSSEPEAPPDAAQEDAAGEATEIAAAEPEAVQEDALSGAEPDLETEPVAASGADLSQTGPDAVPEDALSGAEPGLEAESAAASETGLSETGLDRVPEDALADMAPGLEAEPIAASDAEPAEIGLDAVPEDLPAAADPLEMLPNAAGQDAERASAEPAAVPEDEVAEAEPDAAPGVEIARPEAAPALQEPRSSPAIELLGSLRALWARDPGAARTIAIMVAMAIVVLFLVLRRRRAGAPRRSRAVSAGPRAGRSFVPSAASAAGQAFPEESEPVSGLGLKFPEESDPVGLKLQLAEAYLGLGDAQGAVDLLEEVLAEGDAEQCRQAETLAERLA